MKLTDKDIKTIKYEKRTGYVFPGFILAFGSFYLLFYTLSNQNISWKIIILFAAGLIGISILTSILINRKYNMDLRSGTKMVRIEQVEQIETLTSYEAGSGAMYIPILGDRFPKLWGQKMRPKIKFNLIINGFRFEVEKDDFSKVKTGDQVEMHYTMHSDTLLGIEFKKEKK